MALPHRTFSSRLSYDFLKQIGVQDTLDYIKSEFKKYLVLNEERLILFEMHLAQQGEAGLPQ